MDAAVRAGDRDTAVSYLTLDGGHGTISSGWRLDCAVRPWQRGVDVRARLGGRGARARVLGDGDGADFFAWEVEIGATSWEVYECSVGSAAALERLLNGEGGASCRL